jgi:limonene-1,2-epoxide hydrolase
MSDTNHARVIAFLDEFHSVGAPDFERIGNYFTEDGTYQPLVPSVAKITGRIAIAAALEKQFLTYYECRCEIHASAAMGRAVFEMAGDGHIASWREYWDTGDVMAQMGIGPDELAASM